MSVRDLTICSVSFHSAPYLRLNRELSEAACWQDWWVVQNGPEEKLEGFRVLPGLPRPPEPDELGPDRIGPASYHHAAGLNLLRERINTRFALFLDPDFFVVPKLKAVLQHMLSYRLALYGAPYHIPLDDGAVRDRFPAAFCLFVDCEQVPPMQLDFTPGTAMPGIKPDTGCLIYERFRHLCHDAAISVRREGYGGRYLTASQVRSQGYNLPRLHSDIYHWERGLFGLHRHMKIHRHLKLDASREARDRYEHSITDNLKEIVGYIRSVRKYGPSPGTKE